MSWFTSHPDRSSPELTLLYKTLRDHLHKQRLQVQRVECLVNGNVDFMYRDSGTMRGLTIEFFDGYELSEQDRLWLHPAMNKSTTVFSTGSTTEQIEIKIRGIKRKVNEGWYVEGDEAKGGGDQSVGLYYFNKRNTDTLQTEKEYRIVVEHVPKIIAPPLTGTLGEWLTKYHAIVSTMDTFTPVQRMVHDIFPCATKLSHKLTNTFFRKANSIVYVNYAHVLDLQDSEAYIKLHPTLGYIELKIEPNRSTSIICPATIGFSNHLTAWSDMHPQRISSISKKMTWTDSNKPYHCHIQRATFTRSPGVVLDFSHRKLFDPVDLITAYVSCGSSSSPPTPLDVITLSPIQSAEVSFPISQLLDFIVQNHLRVTEAGHTIFNPQYLTQDRRGLRLPCDVLKSLCLPKHLSS